MRYYPGSELELFAGRVVSAFAAYRLFPFVLPLWQSWANRITLAAAAVMMFALALALWDWLRRHRQSFPAFLRYRTLRMLTDG